MREIKYRIWVEDDKKFRTMIVPSYGQGYTGLKDKNGNEAWEGDIVDIGGAFMFQIIFKFGEFILTRKSDLSGWYAISLHDYIKTSSIIGNIYENPELVKEIYTGKNNDLL